MRWRQLEPVTDFGDTCPNTYTVDMNRNQTAEIVQGLPVKFKLSGSYYYASVYSIDATTMLLLGAPMTVGAGDLEEVYIGNPEGIVYLHFMVAGNYGAAIEPDLLRDVEGRRFAWGHQTAYFSWVQFSHTSVDTGAEAKVNIQHANVSVLTADAGNGIQLGAANTWVSTTLPNEVDTAEYDIAPGAEIELECTVAGGSGDATNLHAVLGYVLP
jgi:hypothetical protein